MENSGWTAFSYEQFFYMISAFGDYDALISGTYDPYPNLYKCHYKMTK